MNVLNDLFICEAPAGTGSFGRVYLAVHKQTETRVAGNIIEDDRTAGVNDRICVAREVTILQQPNHPFIGKVFCIHFESNRVVIMQEFHAHGTL
jgi:serine/threonine protein kinase